MLKSHGIEVAFPVICQSKSALFFRNGKNASETDREPGTPRKRDRRVVEFPAGPENHHRLRDGKWKTAQNKGDPGEKQEKTRLAGKPQEVIFRFF